MKLKLDQGHSLDRFRFDVLDACDVEKVIFIVVDEKSFHLGRVHTAVRLRHVKDRDAEIREHVSRHPPDGENTHQYDGDDQD